MTIRPPVQIGYDEWMQMHLEEMCSSPDVEVSLKTIASHKEALVALQKACRPKSPIEINPTMIREFRRTQLEKGYRPRIVNKHITTIRSALSYAVRAEIIPVNKLFGPHRLLLSVEPIKPRILEVGEVAALMNVATKLRQKTAISLVYYHGMRRRELCDLRWEDIDLDECKLHIVRKPRSKTRVTREVALRHETATLLSQLKAERVNEYVFENPKKFYGSKWFGPLVKEAGLDYCTLHDLRRTCNTVMQDAGVSQQVAMEVLGHTTAKVNREHYTGALLKQQRFAVDAIPSAGQSSYSTFYSTLAVKERLERRPHRHK